MRRSDRIPEHLEVQVRRAEALAMAFLAVLDFVVKNSARDPRFFETHVLSFAAHEYLQSVIALPMLVQEGIHNICKRELRFILEMSIKVCRIQQRDYNAELQVKLDALNEVIDSTNISMQKQIDLGLLPAGQTEPFYVEVGRFYGATSDYVHWSRAQILERISLLEQGRSPGKESSEDIEALNDLIARGLALSLVFLFHAVPQYVTGDWFVEPDGSSVEWPFLESKFIAYIDEEFDYKAERQAKLEEIRAKRWAGVRY